MSEHTPNSQWPCTLGPLSEVRQQSGRYYAPASLGGMPDPERKPGLTVRFIEGEGTGRMQVAGSLWTHVQRLAVDWTFAPDDPRYSKQQDPSRPVSPCHVHAWFHLGDHEVHVDYVRFMSGGPLSGTEEFLVFVDGVFRGRGGHCVVVPAGWRRNWPLAIPLGEQLLLFDSFFTGSSDLAAFTGLSLWKRERAKDELA